MLIERDIFEVEPFFKVTLTLLVAFSTDEHQVIEGTAEEGVAQRGLCD